MKPMLFFAALSAAGVVSNARSEDAQPSPGSTVTFSSGYSASSGRYDGVATTSISAIPLMWSFSRGDFSFDLTIPYLSVHGEPDVIPGEGTVDNLNPHKRGNGAPVGSATGLGDTLLSLTYEFFEDPVNKVGLDLTGSVKLPTASANRGLGTGATDFSIEMDGRRSFGDFTLNGGVGLAFLGSTTYMDLPRTEPIFVAGASYRMTPEWTMGVNFGSGSQRGLESEALRWVDATSTREVVAYFSRKEMGGWRVEFFGLKGLSTASPDYGAGIIFTHAF